MNNHQPNMMVDLVKRPVVTHKDFFDMAAYKHGQYLTKSDHAEFDNRYKPGTVVSNSGIYRCANCGDEIAANKGNPLPPQNHHQHNPPKAIEWQLLVFAVQKK